MDERTIAWLAALDKTEDLATHSSEAFTINTDTMLIIRALNQATRAIIAAIEAKR